MTAHSVGRAGEVAVTSYDFCQWDYDEECLTTMWADIKTNRQMSMNFFCDWQHPELDIFFSLGCFLAFGIDIKQMLKFDCYIIHINKFSF